nr:hypothetical protein [uncultured Friedmanniella sp.]
MSSVLHPVGPEPEQTYWARRLALVLSLVVVVGVVAALISSMLGTGSAVSAAPAPPAATLQPASSVTPSASPTPSAWPTPSTSASSASPSPSASSSAASSSGTSASASPSSTAEAKTSATKKPRPKPTGPVACAPAKLRTTLTGKQTLKPKQDNKLTLSLINGSDSTCTVSVTAKNFELKIFSGTDRIWSSNDCATALKPISRKVKAEDAVEWTMTWDGNRSAKGCKDRPEIPRAGTYFATAQLDGAKPVQLRMILRG